MKNQFSPFKTTSIILIYNWKVRNNGNSLNCCWRPADRSSLWQRLILSFVHDGLLTTSISKKCPFSLSFTSASELWEHHLHSFYFCRHQLYHLCVSIMINQTDYKNSMFCARNCSGCKWLANQKKWLFAALKFFPEKLLIHY